MKYIICLFFLFATLIACGQGSGVRFVEGKPTNTPNPDKNHAVLSYDKTNDLLYQWNGSDWIPVLDSLDTESLDARIIQDSLGLVNLTSRFVNDSIALDDLTTRFVNDSIALDDLTTRFVNDSIALDDLTTRVVNDSIALDDLTTRVVNDSIALDDLTTRVVNDSIALDDLTTRFVNDSIALDDLTTRFVNDSIALDDLTTSVTNDSSKLDSLIKGLISVDSLISSNIIRADSVEVVDVAYDATTWNGNNNVATRNAIRDALEALGQVTILQHQETDGTDGGSAVDSVWTALDVTTEIIDEIGITIVGDTAFTIPSGKFLVEFKHVFSQYNTSSVYVRLYDETGASPFDKKSGYRTSGANYSTDFGGSNVVEPTTTTTYSIQYLFDDPSTTYDLGRATDQTGLTEVYGEIVIRRIGI